MEESHISAKLASVRFLQVDMALSRAFPPEYTFIAVFAEVRDGSNRALRSYSGPL